MRKWIVSLLALSLLCFNLAQGEICSDFYDKRTSNNLYTEIFLGANFLSSSMHDDIELDYHPGFIASASLGYRWIAGIRLEAEYAFRRNSLRKGDFLHRGFKLSGHFQSSSYMGNLLWDVPSSVCDCSYWNIQPFIGGGVGYDFQQIDAKNGNISVKENKKKFAWQIIAGLAYPIFCNTDLSLEYKFHKGGFKHLYNHSLGIGLTYSFGLNL